MEQQEQISVLPATSDKKEENSYGKFKSADELLRAYNALESEFTRRSQKLREYEPKDSELSMEQQANELLKKYPIAEEYAEEIAKEAAQSQTNGNVRLQDALLSVLSKKVKTTEQMAEDQEVITKVLSEENNREQIINGYLEMIKNQQAPISIPKGGAIPVARPYRPDSVQEAGEIAKKIFERI